MTEHDRERMELSGEERKKVRVVVDWHEKNGSHLAKVADLIRVGPYIRNIIIFFVAVGGALAFLSDMGYF